MSRQVIPLSAVLVALSLGCAAGRHPPSMPQPPRAPELQRSLATWVVGVREPEVRYSDLDGPGPSILDSVRDAGRLIGALRKTHLFADVDFTHQLKCAPTIELAVVVQRGERLREVPLWLYPLTLSLSISREDEGVAFTPASDRTTVFDFRYPTTFVVGLLPLLASPVLATGTVPTWSLLSTGDVYKSFRRFLLSNAERLRPFAHESPSESAACLTQKARGGSNRRALDEQALGSAP